jgi:hypothetical protein
MAVGKPVAPVDARRVQSAEQRDDPAHRTNAWGVSAHFQAAAAFNEQAEPVVQNEPHYHGAGGFLLRGIRRDLSIPHICAGGS